MDILALLRELSSAGILDLIKLIVLPLLLRQAILGGVKNRRQTESNAFREFWTRRRGIECHAFFQLRIRICLSCRKVQSQSP